ncbi:hypothetical protein [Candidatus Nitrospira neomarina]|uniref:Uncharacterized protein n=1 Tax=Candidatus Nitrospira neomarina TaxID=3020899 RepID=A0AA96JY01_9BACT|nr:hypothetical protein [Candidatus Nitrospira neomarina]WNM63973.1 hypothetical protein PQG83_09505 [Candidatus Nitrospira neomarina]
MDQASPGGESAWGLAVIEALMHSTMFVDFLKKSHWDINRPIFMVADRASTMSPM